MAEGLTRREEITNGQALADLLNIEQKTLRECLIYLAWLDQQIVELDKTYPEWGPEREEAWFAHNLQDARLRLQAGRIASARFAYEDVLLQAEESADRTPKTKAMIPQILKEMGALPDGKGVTRRSRDDE
ncbi:MAG: hypothetical protein Greene07147_606 [Parcubacteria group bacterium Greene0714_7]|nr:MAG: hypothetical protein Greene07147_606 [Parcubacteria group bacterium Greene0714_7]